jgi:hypothetical protein
VGSAPLLHAKLGHLPSWCLETDLDPTPSTSHMDDSQSGFPPFPEPLWVMMMKPCSPRPEISLA